ncbi:Hok/Gef family protein [Erwinia tracheiphila]|uniref:Hok/Gef family protein n=1 Tax=Erwinia tracheiphila TaxID=65700 RepID=A0A345CX18_9GAMM|nr:Hok/Gef family protein [Erwinia tracheiphila]AXF77985.1 Hok/Gef family protein [Erwinia tracheiphila]UIA83301.1 Hok/Gef family protein [Erwinia tracheiphila]UIA91880.1 Hok/Gef family protein [Erwinia tracheiphila]
MPAKYALTGVVVLCIAVLCFTWMVRGSLCELSIKQGNTEMRARLAYEPRK